MVERTWGYVIAHREDGVRSQVRAPQTWLCESDARAELQMRLIGFWQRGIAARGAVTRKSVLRIGKPA